MYDIIQIKKGCQMVLEIKVNDDYQKELLTILENLKGVMIDTISKKESVDDLASFTKEIEKGLSSGVSNTSCDELFDRLKSKYV
jgi:hypothetical protein